MRLAGPGTFCRVGVATTLVGALAAACSFSAGDYRDTEYRCGPGDACPTGFHCAGGACVSHDADILPDPDAPPASDAAPACAGNLVENPSFETGTSGWGGVGGPLAQVNEGHDGTHAGEKCYDESETYYNISDSPDTVSGTEVGNVYTVSAWLRSDTDQTIHAVIRAKDSANEPLEQTSTTLIVKPDWQEVTIQHAVVDPAAYFVETYFSVVSPKPGDCFQLDDVCFLAAP